MTKKILLALLIPFTTGIRSQHPWQMMAGPGDPVYTTYAAPIERSNYTIDHAYHLVYNDPGMGPVFRSTGAGMIGLALYDGVSYKYAINTYYEEPKVIISYPDATVITSVPYENIRLHQLFAVFTSGDAMMDVTVENTGRYDQKIVVFPFIDLSGASFSNVATIPEGFLFRHHQPRDKWMQQHNIPLEENYQNVFSVLPETGTPGISRDPVSMNEDGDTTLDGNTLFFRKEMLVPAGGTVTFRVVRSIGQEDAAFFPGIFLPEIAGIEGEKILEEGKKLYHSVPERVFMDESHEAVYYSAFTMMRQCMMPPEGACDHNYYVFSREPKWGWGYGGQVFHESLAMLAYAFMDPLSAMNSQRVYMQRQREDGYINYRTGPYLNEDIFHEGEYTSSAPWYNYQNYEIYKITGDRRFLEEAYESGKSFYQYYTRNRDKDHDGLCEWGAHAVLESVRDARVAVWDKVGWPSNFEGPDLNSMLVMEARSLAHMARELGKENEADSWDEDAGRRASLINDFMWDPVSGFYYNIDRADHDFSFEKDNDLKIKEIIGFLPLWAGIASEEQAAQLVGHLLNENEFWRRNGIPTLSAGEDYYNPMGYWNGPVWVEWNYLVFRGLLDYGYEEEARELTRRLADHLAHHLSKSHNFYEFYSPDRQQAGYHSTYIWTGLIARFFIDLDDRR